MSTNSRRKGSVGELEWAHKWGGRKVSRVGYDGHDVDTPPLHAGPLSSWEVKRRKTLPAWLGDWLLQMDRQQCDAIAFRADRGDWWVLIPADRLEEQQ